MTIADRLAEYAVSLRVQDLDEEVVLESKKRILDSIGCAIGAFNEKPVKAVRKMVQQVYPGKAATMLGTKTKTTPDMATFANGLMVRYFDFNDTYLSKEPGHPSDNIPACLAAAEMRGSSGRELLTAIALAYEVQCRLCDAASLRFKGWDHVCYGLVSSALATGRLLGLSVEEMAQAVNISLNSHIALRQVRAGELSEWKGCSFANAARNAVFSAIVAKEGVTGPSPIFEGEMGFFQQVSGPFELNVDAFGGNGRRFKLPETYLKFYPAEYHAQTAVTAALQARAEVGIISDAVSVEIETHEAGYTILGKDKEKWSPTTRETADHSLPYIVGVTLIDGKLDNSSYSEERIRDPALRGFLEKIKVTEDKSLTAMYPDAIANRITVKTIDGRTVTRQVNLPKGHPKNPMTREEIEEKFRLLTKRFLTNAQVDRILEFVWGLDKRGDASALPGMCVIT